MTCLFARAVRRVGKAKRAHHSRPRTRWWARRDAPLPTLRKLCRPRSGREGRQLLAAAGDEANAGEAEQHQQQFGLTRAEAALVEEMLKCGDMPEVAARLGIASATARTHLHRIFRKDGHDTPVGAGASGVVARSRKRRRVRRVGWAKEHCAVPTVLVRGKVGGHASLCPPYETSHFIPIQLA